MANVIESAGLSKRFMLRHNRSGSIKERFLGLIHSSIASEPRNSGAARCHDVHSGRRGCRHHREKWIGEKHAVAARRWYSPSNGRRSRGPSRLPYRTMIELGIGFHPELTGSENLYLSASVHGLRRSQIDALYDRIVEYSGLAAFMDVAMKNYSSGMTVRLAFAIAANLDPDMLLLDEVFAVGDEAFQQQCIRTVQQFRTDGRTILFVSHSATAIRSVCDRVCLLDRGRLLFDGPVSRGLQEYERLAASGAKVGAPAEAHAADEEGGWHRVVPGGRWVEPGVGV